MNDGDAANIREVFDLVEKSRAELLEAISHGQQAQLDFNMNMATRVEALSTRLSGHEQLSAHSSFVSSMNEALGEARDSMKAMRQDLDELKMRFARAAAAVGVLLFLLTVALNIAAKLL